MNKLFLSLFFSLGMTACTLGVAVRDEPLLDRYWRALEIDGQAVVVTNNRAEPHLVLASEKNSAHGSDGCNRFHGSYDLASGLHFGRLASTMMACLPPVNLLARNFSQALAATTSYRIQGKQMELLDADDRVRMRLEATFLK